MPRRAREKSESGTYHVIWRGINRQILFENDEDRAKYLDYLQLYREKCGCRVLGYCLMDNHVHLLLAEGEEELSQVMKRLGVSYVHWYNRKYGRCGPLFQDRFRSEAVEDERYLLTALRYIHQNPRSLGISWETYPWSSYRGYMGQDFLLENDFVLGLFGRDRSKAIAEYQRFMQEESAKACLDAEMELLLSDQEANQMLQEQLHGLLPIELQHLGKEERDVALRGLKQLEGLSTRQIARLTGISQSVIVRA